MTQETDLQNERVRVIKELYELDGRNDPKHKFHSVFTGLWLNREQIWKKIMAHQGISFP